MENGPAYVYAATTDPSGYFTLTLNADAGDYAWYVKNPQTLVNSGTFTLAGAAQELQLGTLRTGDANNDNCVRASDFAILKTTFAKGLGDPGYDPRADFNSDNQVNVSDFNLQKANFGFCGPPPP
jgi:hypothetical protein